ncbi:PH domain-containing protein [Bailinhaonella thermotolerans]|uniref:Low molecular weight protein antigen 6 PH domain-containing protein n=1 Tax=Bailinhaonella thermotolerans TaxID=1070861 RepID=A0A3A4AQ11_9ACTN|nr:hypothetical protein [Bailinhaonella thermotolerans]RJL30505.1 hypothetical protein D5H75_23400 [Bailinhaonella thermotolerans]
MRHPAHVIVSPTREARIVVGCWFAGAPLVPGGDPVKLAVGLAALALAVWGCESRTAAWAWGIAVLTPVRRTSVRWADVAGIEVAGESRRHHLRLRLTDGRTVDLAGSRRFGAAEPGWHRARLLALREEAVAAGTPAPGGSPWPRTVCALLLLPVAGFGGDHLLGELKRAAAPLALGGVLEFAVLAVPVVVAVLVARRRSDGGLLWGFSVFVGGLTALGLCLLYAGRVPYPRRRRAPEPAPRIPGA